MWCVIVRERKEQDARQWQCKVNVCYPIDRDRRTGHSTRCEYQVIGTVFTLTLVGFDAEGFETLAYWVLCIFSARPTLSKAINKWRILLEYGKRFGSPLLISEALEALTSHGQHTPAIERAHLAMTHGETLWMSGDLKELPESWAASTCPCICSKRDPKNPRPPHGLATATRPWN